MMLADVQHGSIWDVVVSLWIPATIGAIAAVYAAKIARDNRRRLDTGRPRPLGATVQDIAQTVEVLNAQVHTNTTEILGAREKAETAAQKAEIVADKAETAAEKADRAANQAARAVQRLEDWIEQSTHINAEILRRLPSK